MHLPRRDWLRLAGLGLSAVALPSFTTVKGDHIYPHVINEADGSVKLRSNENTYGCSPKAQAAMAAQVASLNRYQWGVTERLIDSIASHHHVEAKNILVGAGSTELLDIIGRYAAQGGGELLLSDPVFDYWTVTTTKLGLKNVRVPVTAEKFTDLAGMRQAMSEQTRLVYICNPNNPTGTLCKREELVQFIRDTPETAVVMVDEAYLEYSDELSVVPLIKAFSNMVVVRTFSKIHGLAGARIGYAVASAELIAKIESLQSSPNASVGGASAAGAIASLKDAAFGQGCKEKNKRVMEYTLRELTQLKCRMIHSHANFIYFSLENYPHDYFARLKAANIEGTKIYEEKGKWTRITIGTEEEMMRFIKAIK